MSSKTEFVLGSGSPRRLELLSLLVDRSRIEVIVPDCEEFDFADVHTSDAINDVLRQNVRLKQQTVVDANGVKSGQVLLSADTVVVVTDGDGFRTLGKPPREDWEAAVTDWFTRYYAVGPHWVRTGFSLLGGDLDHLEIVETEIRFRESAMDWLPWYLTTGEPVGKAGGYGIQGAGSVFAESIAGSLSNVIGLPLEALLDTLRANSLL